MYTDEDLNKAVDSGIFTADSVGKFRELTADIQESPSVDEEKFRLVTSFNDIFVVIACALFLACLYWLIEQESNEPLAYFVLAASSWGLAEFFVRKKKMALPAILLLFSFIGGIAMMCITYFADKEIISAPIAAIACGLAAWLHWQRFKVPVTVAAGLGTIIAFTITALLDLFPDVGTHMNLVLFISGAISFLYAMYWDMSDLSRITRRSDTAFWLHILSAPLITHPIFSNFQILEGSAGTIDIFIVLLLFALITVTSLVIDRRAFMVSSLIYVLYALTELFENYGFISYSFAITGIFIGATLLLLSGFWHSSRAGLVKLLPLSIQQRIPQVS